MTLYHLAQKELQGLFIPISGLYRRKGAKLNQRWKHVITKRRFKQGQCSLKWLQEFAKQVVTNKLNCKSV